LFVWPAVRAAVIAVDWKAWRNLSLSASLERARRTSSDPAENFEARLATLSASLLF
jgi:hypothetical protein